MKMANNKNAELTDKQFWDDNWAKTASRADRMPFSAYKYCRFHKLLKQYLPIVNRDTRLLEVGCVPGRHLVYFQKVFGYHVEGVDFSDHIKKVHDVMRFHGIDDKAYHLYQDDFLTFQHEPYDVVASFGFLEHFVNWEEMLQKHIQLLKPDGYLVVSVPNLQNFQYLLHKWLDPEFENDQVLEATDLRLLRDAIEKAGLTIMYAGYYQTFQFFCHHRKVPRSFLRRWAINGLRVIGALFTRSGINIPNKNFSPQLICIARKKE